MPRTALGKLLGERLGCAEIDVARVFAAMQAMGASNARITKTGSTQVSFAAPLSFWLGVGLAGLSGRV